MHVLTIPLNV